MFPLSDFCYRLFLSVLIFCVFFGLFILPVVGRTFYFPSFSELSPIYILRFNRILVSMVVGGGLAMGGLVFQSLFRNPLATPYTLGIASGASFGAAVGFHSFNFGGLFVGVSWLFGGFVFFGISPVAVGAFFGAMLATFIVFLLAGGKDASSERMLLAGVAVNFFFASLIVLIQYVSAPHDALQILHWTMGELQNAVMSDFWRMFPFVILLFFVLLFFSRELNIFITGWDHAKSLGVDVGRLRLFLFVVVSLVVGVIVSVAGPIGFVGLMVPHIARLIVGINHRRLVPITFLIGAIFLAICDTISRSILYPVQIPVGVATNLLGGPFFIWLLIKSEKRLG
ncbi:MAG: iron ABC transporter permease [Planctomycetaceae bacterium]|jgi:iron complex transport system permease protein|nr:iron ABC transporter permease [Planctomycetaceae bacterium]